jgi:glutamate-1-semialdehyde 2,1-aminomutase
MKSAKGAYLTDEDDNTYIDYINSWGPAIVGHTHPVVLEAIQKQAENGFFWYSYGIGNRNCQIHHHKCSEYRTNSYGFFGYRGVYECNSFSKRLYRQEKIIKFEGCYHGHSDSFLIKAGSGAATFGNPNSPGVTQGLPKILCWQDTTIGSKYKIYLKTIQEKLRPSS